MAPRASWTGQLKFSLVTFPIRVYNVVSSTSKVSLNQLHGDGCHHRLRQTMCCPEHGAVERDKIEKGYEFEKDRYVVIGQMELDSLQVETTKTVELVQFVDEEALSPLYFDTPYFVAPDGPVATQGFCLLREAMRHTGKIGIGRVVMHGREHVVALDVYGKGFVMHQLHYRSEVRDCEPYFEDVGDDAVNPEHLALAVQLVTSSSGPFQPEKYTDRYQDALLALIKAKREGSAAPVLAPAAPGPVVNLMETLKASLLATRAAPVAAPSRLLDVKPEPPKPARKAKKSRRERKKP